MLHLTVVVDLHEGNRRWGRPCCSPFLSPVRLTVVAVDAAGVVLARRGLSWKCWRTILKR